LKECIYLTSRLLLYEILLTEQEYQRLSSLSPQAAFEVQINFCYSSLLKMKLIEVT